MGCIFEECSSLKSLPDISKWNLENVTNMVSFINVQVYYQFQIYQNGILKMLQIWYAYFMNVHH